LGKNCSTFFFSFFLFVHNFLIALTPFILSQLSFYLPYRLIIIILISRFHCTFFYQEIRLNGQKFKSFEKSDEENIDTLPAIFSKSLLCKLRMSPAENKRLEVHACSPRPHIVPSFSSTSIFFLSCFSFIPETIVPFLLLCLTIFLSLFSFMFIITLPFSFLILRQKKLFVAALLFANLHRIIYMYAVFTLDSNSLFTCFTCYWTRIEFYMMIYITDIYTMSSRVRKQFKTEQ